MDATTQHDRPSEHDCGPDVLAVMLLDLLAVDLRRIERRQLGDWVQAVALALTALPIEHDRRRWLELTMARVLRAFPRYQGGPDAIRHDLTQLVARAAQEWGEWKGAHARP